MTALLEAIELERVHGSGAHTVAALRGVDLALGHGEFVAGDRAERLREVHAAQPARWP